VSKPSWTVFALIAEANQLRGGDRFDLHGRLLDIATQ